MEQQQARIRDKLVNDLIADLWGPEEENQEIIKESPLSKYIVGILYPRNSRAEFDNQSGLDEIESDDDDSLKGETASRAGNPLPVHQMKPSSMGLTCELDTETKTLVVEVSYGYYKKNEEGFIRIPVIIKKEITFEEKKGTLPLFKNPGGPTTQIKWYIREREKRKTLSIFFINSTDSSEDKPENCIFQAKFQLKGVFPERPFLTKQKGLGQDKGQEFAYRKKVDFAIGHGCSVTWDDVKNRNAGVIGTTFFPESEIPQVAHRAFSELEMGELTASEKTCFSRLEFFIDQYKKWIEKQKQSISPEGDYYFDEAQETISECEKTLSRMKKGLEYLKENRKAFQAFQFADRAMLLQRTRSQKVQLASNQDYKESHSLQEKHFWRPFQIAFLLSNLPGTGSPSHPEREIVDLLWFPTGGGKTEAYLGLAAFSMSLRRLEKPSSYEGVDVLMRYTLRLLSNQQFQRATTLICACEFIRRENPQIWGEKPFLIGLWLGMKTTPNTIKDTRTALEEIKNNPQKSSFPSGNPIQILSCPWCGKKLTEKNYMIEEKSDWLLIHCSNENCLFFDPNKKANTSLPVVLVDENIYRRLPTMVIATVDKFARLPWEPRTGNLFGHIHHHCDKHGWLNISDPHGKKRCGKGGRVEKIEKKLSPPGLIIQDELHLISGPLGTLMGLYETAIEYLSSEKIAGEKISPKIIASTATIKNAPHQVKGLFARKISQFPPVSPDPDDDFFSYTDNSRRGLGRLYMGIYAPGRSMKTVLLRVYAQLLDSTGHQKNLSDNEPDHVDPFWTLIGYFNSLRELGGARRLVEDDIPKRLDYLSTQRKIKTKKNFTLKRFIRQFDELTSTKKAREIPEILDQLEKTVASGVALDVLLASNMISVGMDVSRLGLMVVNGQPKSTSEYIQATSRIGRQSPGLVVTLYNWSRPRDISHFEQFKSYHEMFYRFVEPTSVTPFAPRARDRGLHAVLVGLIRITVPELASTDKAGAFSDIINKNPEITRPVIDSILERLSFISDEEKENTRKEVESLLKNWERRAEKEGDNLSYSPPLFIKKGEGRKFLLKHAGDEYEEAWLTMDSLRNVETESNLYYCF